MTAPKDLSPEPGIRNSAREAPEDRPGGPAVTTVKIVHAGNTLKALVSDGAQVTACGIVNGVWWCECRPGWLKLRALPGDVCPHLYLVGASKQDTGLQMPDTIEATGWTAGELLGIGQCSAPCLTAFRDSSCSCPCCGRWHGALRDAAVGDSDKWLGMMVFRCPAVTT